MDAADTEGTTGDIMVVILDIMEVIRDTMDIPVTQDPTIIIRSIS
jgi:hypothetical protein